MIQPATCLRYLEPYGLRRGPAFHVTAAGTDERMPPAIVNRPAGTQSWLLMHFHCPALIRTASGETAWFPEGRFMIWNDTDGHYYGNPDHEWSHSWIHCVGDPVARLVATAGVPQRTPFAFPGRARFNALVTQMYEEITAWEPPDDTILFHLLELVLAELSRAFRGGQARRVVPEKIVVVKQYLDRNFGKRVSLEQLARLARLSPPHLCAAFKHHFGRAPIDHLIGLRLEHARHLLGDVNRNIAEVAAAVGYDDPFQFSKLFKKRFGLSPRAFRQSTATFRQ
jgi:AraC-like DNA-binding protein